MLISSWCDSDDKNLFFHVAGFYLILLFCSFWLLSKFDNIVIQLKFYLFGLLTGPEKITTWDNGFSFFFFSAKFKMPDESHDTLYSLNCFTELFQKNNPGHMLIRVRCDSEISFLCGLHKKWVTVLYFSIIQYS